MIALGPTDAGWPSTLPATLHLGVLGYSGDAATVLGAVGGVEMTIMAGPSSGNTSAARLVLGMPQQTFLGQDTDRLFTLTLPPDRRVGTLLLSVTGLTGDDPDLYVSAGGTAHSDGACDEGAACWSSAQIGDDVLEIPGAAAEAGRALALTPTPVPTPTLTPTPSPSPTLTRRAASPASGACGCRPTHTTPPSRCSPPCRAA